MDELRAVKEFNALNDLVNNESVVNVLQNLLPGVRKNIPNSIMEIGFHKLKYQVKVLIVFSSNHVMKFN